MTKTLPEKNPFTLNGIIPQSRYDSNSKKSAPEIPKAPAKKFIARIYLSELYAARLSSSDRKISIKLYPQIFSTE